MSHFYGSKQQLECGPYSPWAATDPTKHTSISRVLRVLNSLTISVVIQNSGFFSPHVFSFPKFWYFPPLAGMSMRHSGPPLPRDLRHCGTQSTVGASWPSRLSLCLLVCLDHSHFTFFPLTLPSLPPYNFFSSRDGGLSAYTAICAAVLPCVAGLEFHIYPVGNPTPVSITTASSVCAVGSWVVLRQSSCHTPFVIVALLLLNHSSS